MHILFTGDIIRPNEDNSPGEQNANINWLANLLGGHFLTFSSGFVVGAHGSDGLDGHEWLSQLGLPPTKEGWLQALALPRWEALESRMDALIAGIDLVIGFEMPLPLRVHLEWRRVQHIDIAISPYRFCDDVLLMAMASDIGMRSRLGSGVLELGIMRGEAAAIISRSRRQQPQKRLNEHSLTIIGQSAMDKSLIVNGKLARWADFEKQIAEELGKVELVYFKAHPYAREEDNEANILLFSKFAPVERIDEHTYTTLARPELNRFLTLSSGVVFEAPMFGKTVKHLIPLSYKISCDERDIASDCYRNLGSAIWSSSFWQYVITGASMKMSISSWPLPANRIRDSIGAWWSYESMDRHLRLSEKQLSGHIEQIKTQLLAQAKAYGVALASHERALASHEGALASHEGALASHEGALASHEGALASHEGVLASHEGVLASHEGVLASHEGALASHEGALVRHEGALASHEGAIASQEGALANHEEALANLLGRLGIQSVKLATARKKNHELENRIKRLERKLDKGPLHLRQLFRHPKAFVGDVFGLKLKPGKFRCPHLKEGFVDQNKSVKFSLTWTMRQPRKAVSLVFNQPRKAIAFVLRQPRKFIFGTKASLRTTNIEDLPSNWEKLTVNPVPSLPGNELLLSNLDALAMEEYANLLKSIPVSLKLLEEKLTTGGNHNSQDVLCRYQLFKTKYITDIEPLLQSATQNGNRIPREHQEQVASIPNLLRQIRRDASNPEHL